MIAVDTNILVFAHRTESPKHEDALSWLRSLAEGHVPWALPVFCLGEFLRVVTHRSIFNPPSTLKQAIEALENLLESPSIRLLFPGVDYFEHLAQMVQDGQASGNLVFDAQIAALCREHGVDKLLTDDKDFARFARLKTISPEVNPKLEI